MIYISSTCRRVTGRIRETERPDTDRQAVFVYYNDPVVFTSVKNQDSSHNTMVMAVDIQQSAAKNDFDRARTILSRRNGGTTLFNGKILLLHPPPLFSYEFPKVQMIRDNQCQTDKRQSRDVTGEKGESPSDAYIDVIY